MFKGDVSDQFMRMNCRRGKRFSYRKTCGKAFENMTTFM